MMNKRHTISILLLVCAFCGNAQVDHSASGEKNEKAVISFRIGEGRYMSENRFEELLGLFNKYRGVTDEITFFTATTHAPMPLPAFKDRIAILKDRISLAKKNGYRAGLNILTTIGHHEENLDYSLSGDYTYMTDIDGKVCKGSYCPNDKNYQEYIKSIYKEMALSGADYIWIDDDIRLAGHMPLHLTCFCENCLSIFEQEFGVKYTREEFKMAVNEGTSQGKLKIRKQWLAHNRKTIANLFQLIETTVHQHKPEMPLGFMTGDRFFEGYDFDNWAKVLAGDGGSEVMWRPGGGFYNDDILAHMVGKSHDIGRQVSVLPPYITNIQSEIENYTYQRLSKSAFITGVEAASHIGAGATGAAFNVLGFYDEPLDEYEPLVAKLHEMRGFYDLLVQNLGRSNLKGISSYWHKDSFADGALYQGSWFNSGVRLAPYTIDDLGLPTTYSSDGADVIKLTKDNIHGMSPDDIKKLLSRGVYMEAEALTELNRLGYGDLTGFEVVGEITRDGIERLTNHPLNTAFANRVRDARQANYKGAASLLKKTDPKSEILADLINYEGEQTGAAIMGVFENKLGGRICVAGYHPWSSLNTLAKSSQLKSIVRWLAKDELLGYVNSYHKMNLWIREPQDGRMAMVLANSSMDEAKQVELLLKSNSGSIRVYDMDCKEITINSTDSDGVFHRFVIPQIGPWQMRLIVSE